MKSQGSKWSNMALKKDKGLKFFPNAEKFLIETLAFFNFFVRLKIKPYTESY